MTMATKTKEFKRATVKLSQIEPESSPEYTKVVIVGTISKLFMRGFTGVQKAPPAAQLPSPMQRPSLLPPPLLLPSHSPSGFPTPCPAARVPSLSPALAPSCPAAPQPPAARLPSRCPASPSFCMRSFPGLAACFPPGSLPRLLPSAPPPSAPSSHPLPPPLPPLLLLPSLPSLPPPPKLPSPVPSKESLQS
ncbi:hypothetical protein H6P81_020190 [Aristolochia fimbriata]|uniref:Uncharacterized protein n=1 Tax=Aristolochia fimbriata TaxID=158543 RepID=A0AAV7DTU2_ARIFI|nr:hypothetical protein H6P81_020190 [Aristolochia fimbriata]